MVLFIRYLTGAFKAGKSRKKQSEVKYFVRYSKILMFVFIFNAMRML